MSRMGTVMWTETWGDELTRLIEAAKEDHLLRAVMNGPDWRPPEMTVHAIVMSAAYQQEHVAMALGHTGRYAIEKTEPGWKLLVVRQDNNKVVEIDASRVERWVP